MRAFGPDEMISSPVPIDCRARRTTNARRYGTNADAFDGKRRTSARPALPRRDGRPELTHSPRLRTDDLFTLRRAALQGIGAVLVPRLLVRTIWRAARLIRLLPSLKAHVGIVHACFPVAARNGSRGARAPRLALRDCSACSRAGSQWAGGSNPPTYDSLQSMPLLWLCLRFLLSDQLSQQRRELSFFQTRLNGSRTCMSTTGSKTTPRGQCQRVDSFIHATPIRHCTSLTGVAIRCS